MCVFSAEQKSLVRSNETCTWLEIELASYLYLVNVMSITYLSNTVVVEIFNKLTDSKQIPKPSDN